MQPHRVIVVGAGIIGLVAAFELRRRGVRVAVVDPDPAGGATHAAAGMLAPVSEVQYGQEALLPLMVAAAAEYGPFLTAVGRATDLPTGYRSESTLVVAADPADARALNELADHQVAAGLAVSRLTTREARRLEPGLGPRLAAAVEIEGDHQVDPRRLAEALVDALAACRPIAFAGAPDAGPAEFVPQQVTRLLTRGEDVVGVRLDSGAELPADAVVLANGTGAARLDGLSPGLDLRLRPVHGDIVRLGVPDHLLAPGERHLLTRTVRGIVGGRPVYLVPREDRTLVLGATSREDGCAGVRVDGVHHLLHDGRALVPALGECEILELTARARPGTPDDLPYLGVTGTPGLFVSTGHFRHGVLLAPLAGRLLAELVTGRADPDRDRTRDEAHLAAADPGRHARRETATPDPATRIERAGTLEGEH